MRGVRGVVTRAGGPMGGAASRILALLLAAAVLTGCRTSGLVFGGSRLRIVSPSHSSMVTLPLTVTWTTGEPAQPGDRFAVLLDGTTIQPGQSVLDLVPDSCRRLPTCAVEELLERKNVWLTSDPSLVLDMLPTTSPTGRDGSREYHTLTVVVLDGALRRIGEEFASTEFVYVRRGG